MLISAVVHVLSDISLVNLLTRFAALHTMSLLDPTLSYKDFKKVDMVIEAVFEDLKIKHAVVKEVEQVRWKTDQTIIILLSLMARH